MTEDSTRPLAPPSKLLGRRSWLSLGAVGALSAIVSRGLLDEASAGELAEPHDGSGPRARAKHCIVLWMNGGPSHIDTFDPKPGSSSAGPFKAIRTRRKDVMVSEHLPRVAERSDKLAILRGVGSKEGNHQRAHELAHTGHVPNPTVRAPSIGAWIAKTHGASKGSALDLPPFISLAGPSAGAGFFGNPYDPFVVQDPGQRPVDLEPARAIGPRRDAARRRFLEAQEADFAERTGDPQVSARRAIYDRARAMMSSKDLRAFDLDDEPAADLAAYGDHDFGRGCLVARRLVEVGVPFVEIMLDGWDTHQNNFERVAGRLSILDPAMSALISDLDARGLLDSTLVVWMGEFGRSPRINGDEGRDHHPGASNVVMAGAGIRGGVVHGETDGDGNAAVKDGVGTPDVIATVAHLMGIDPRTEVTTPGGRPISVTQRGKPVEAILA